MATSLGSFSVDVMANIARFESDLGKAHKLAEQRSAQIGKTFSQAGQVVGAGLAVAASGIAAMAKQAIDAADQFNLMSQKLGVSVESLSTLAYAAKQSDVELGALQNGLVKLSKNASDAAQGTGAAASAFTALGVSVTNADGSLKDSDKLFKETASALDQFKDGANKTALAVALLGRSGADLLPIMKGGAAAIEEAEQRARDLGQEISTNTAQQADAFGDRMGELQALVSGFGNDIARQVLPSLVSLSERFVDSGIEARKSATGVESFANFLKGGVAAAAIAKNAVEALTNVIAAQVDIMIAAGKAAYEVSENYGSLTNIAYKLANGGLKPLSKINEEFTASLASATGAAKGGIREAITDVTDAFEDLWPTVKQTTEALGEDGQDKGAAPAMRNMAAAAAEAAAKLKEAEKANREYVQQWKEWNKEADEAKQYNEELALALETRFAEQSAGLEEEIRLLALTGAARDQEIIRLEAERMAREGNNGSIEDAVAHYQEQLTRFAKAKELADAAAEFESIWLNAAENVGDALTTALFDGAQSGADAIKDVMEQLARDLVRFWIQKNIVIPMQAQVTGGGGGAIGGFGNGSGWMGYAQAAAGFAGIGGFVGGNVFGGSRENSTGGAVGGAAGGLIAGTATGAAVIGAGLSAAGMGAALGSVVPIVGTIIGALIGAAIGELFETDPRIRVSSSEQDARFESAFATGGVARDALPSGTATTFAEAITTFDNALAAMLSTVSTGASQIAEIQAELRDWEADVSNGGVSVANVLQLRFDAILSTFDQDVQDAVRSAGDLQAQVEALAGAFVYPQQIQAALQQLADASEWAGMSELERQTAAINAQFDALVEQFETWGASAAQLAQVEAYRTEQLGRLTQAEQANTEQLEGAARSYAEFIARFGDELRGGSPFQRALEDVQNGLHETIDAANELARAAGLAAAREEDLIGARRRAEREMANLIAGLTDTVIGQIADLYGTGVERLEAQLAGVDAAIGAIDRSDTGFGMIQALQREQELTAQREALEQQLEGQRAAEEALRRQMGALELAQNLADLSLARGVSFDRLASELGLDLDRFGADLGIEGSAVAGLIASLEAESLTATDYAGGVDRIVEAIEAITRVTDPKPGRIDDPTDPAGRGGKFREIGVEPAQAMTERLDVVIEELRLTRLELAELQREGNANTGTTAGEMAQIARASVRQSLDREAVRPRSDRLPVERLKVGR